MVYIGFNERSWKKGNFFLEKKSNNKKNLRKQLNNESTYGTTLGIFVLSI
jgi:hypothetical protein